MDSDDTPLGNDGNAEQTRRRIRQKKRRKKQASTSLWIDLTIGRHAGVAWFVLMSAVAVALGTHAMGEVGMLSQGQGPYVLGAKAADVLYQFGPPSSRSAQDRLWSYDATGTRIMLRLDDRQQVSSVTCLQTIAEATGCPEHLGVRMGSSEAEVRRALSHPDHERLTGDTKSIDYDRLGVHLVLKRTQVISIEQRAGGSPWARLKLALWRLLP